VGLVAPDGGMAEYLLVPSTRYLIPLGSLDPREAAPLTDAGLTSYHAVKRSLHLLGLALQRWSSAQVVWVKWPYRCSRR
jgi:NADPH:quinone reductase-like Zn-dependent oxidoreductase